VWDVSTQVLPQPLGEGSYYSQVIFVRLSALIGGEIDQQVNLDLSFIRVVYLYEYLLPERALELSRLPPNCYVSSTQPCLLTRRASLPLIPDFTTLASRGALGGVLNPFGV
jgi:hypothetical protein